ncbi:hypothetical protein ETD85_19380, partial [Nonomuraea zeae]
MRIMLTVLGGQGSRDVVIDGDDGATVAAVGEALSDRGPLAKVVRLPRARAPYGLSAADVPFDEPPAPRVPRPRRPERTGMGQGPADDPTGRNGTFSPRPGAGPREGNGGGPGGRHGRSVGGSGGGSGGGLRRDLAGMLWRNGRPLDPRARAATVLRDGDIVTLDPQLARATLIEEPGGVAEVRV